MATFPKLTEAVQTAADQAKENARHFILYGYMPSWAPEHRTDPDRGIKAHATAHTWDQYQRGEIDRGTAAARAIKRAEREEDKRLTLKLDKLLRVAGADDLEAVYIYVKWNRSSAWGYNPTASATVHSKTRSNPSYFTGRASGCGYDKRSAAVAEALNQSDSVLKVLYIAAEEALQSGQAPADLGNGNITWRGVLGYGTGYSIIPHFEGGVGVNCFWHVLRDLGYSVHEDERDKHTDHYAIAKEE